VSLAADARVGQEGYRRRGRRTEPEYSGVSRSLFKRLHMPVQAACFLSLLENPGARPSTHTNLHGGGGGQVLMLHEGEPLDRHRCRVARAVRGARLAARKHLHATRQPAIPPVPHARQCDAQALFGSSGVIRVFVTHVSHCWKKSSCASGCGRSSIVSGMRSGAYRSVTAAAADSAAPDALPSERAGECPLLCCC